MNYAAQSHIGMVRKENQDSYCVFDTQGRLFAMVADGLGGHNGGSVASGMAAKIMTAHVKEHYERSMSEQQVVDMIMSGISIANQEIFDRATSESELAGMGTTAVIAMFHNGEVIVINVGDSRAYIIEKRKIVQITTDQTLVQELLEKGEITIKQAQTHPKKHIITQAIGTESCVIPEVIKLGYNHQGILLCSDGLNAHLDDKQIFKTISLGTDVQESVKKLIDAANTAGGEDNITAIIITNEEAGGEKHE